MQRIAQALGVPVAQLWAPPRRSDAAEIVRAGDGGVSEGYGAIVRELRPSPGRPWCANGAPVAAVAGARGGTPGEVLVYVARGVLEVDLDGTVHALGEGDAMLFDGTIPHRLRRRGGPGTRALYLATG